MSEAKHSAGPWRWEYNAQSKSICLVGGRPRFDKTVMQFERWGMRGATPLFNAEIAGDEYNVMERVCDRAAWVKPFEGREHHAGWCAGIVHPDARLIAAAPDLLEALRAVVENWTSQFESNGHLAPEWCKQARAAIAKATGGQQ